MAPTPATTITITTAIMSTTITDMATDTSTSTSTRNCPRRRCACGPWKSILTEKGLIDPAALDLLIETY